MRRHSSAGCFSLRSFFIELLIVFFMLCPFNHMLIFGANFPTSDQISGLPHRSDIEQIGGSLSQINSMHINFLSLLLVADALEELLRLLLIHFKRYFVQSAFEHACLHFYECVFVCVACVQCTSC